MTDLVNLDEVAFVNGRPLFEFSHIYRCFRDRGNGLLFRLVNEETKQWAFYNDTADTIMKIKTTFGPGSKVRALRRTHVELVPKEDGSVDETCVTTASLEVHPFRTELFIEGTVNGFSIDFVTEAAPVTDVKFAYRRPAVPYDKMYKCFKESGNGLLFRLVDEKKKKWYFYNDTRTYEMQVSVEFGERDSVKALGKTENRGPPEENPHGVVLALSIAPGKTEEFAEGDMGEYRLSFAAVPLNNDQPVDPSELKYENGSPSADIVSGNSRVYSCFKNNGNGLLFRIVDEERALWAFYNDTTDYIMKAIVRFPHDAVYEPCEHTVVEQDPGSDDAMGTIATLLIPPLETIAFLKGLPQKFVISFSAESAHKSRPEENPSYENGAPDPAVARYQEVYKCFKDHGNGLLFRLVDVKRGRWSFYNDTKDTIMKVKVSFAKGASVQALGKTTVGQDDDMGTVYMLEVEPLQTELFAEGDTGSFTTKFAGVRCRKSV